MVPGPGRALSWCVPHLERFARFRSPALPGPGCRPSEEAAQKGIEHVEHEGSQSDQDTHDARDSDDQNEQQQLDIGRSISTRVMREWITVWRAVPRHRKRGRATTGTSLAVETPHVIPMVDARTRRAHLVTDDAVAAGRADAGRYAAVCGAVVLAASLTTPEASYCASCAYWRRHETVPWWYHSKTADGAGDH